MRHLRSNVASMKSGTGRLAAFSQVVMALTTGRTADRCVMRSRHSMSFDVAVVMGAPWRSIVFRPETSEDFQMIGSSATIGAALSGPAIYGNGVQSAREANKQLNASDYLVDPVTVIGPALLADLVSVYHMRVMNHEESAAVSDYVLSVKVTGWGALYQLPNMSRYGGTIQAKAWITETAGKNSFREAKCFVRPHTRPDSPNLGELLQNNGGRLRAEIDAATHECIGLLRGSLLGE
jgi:hypothetical protein